MTRELLPCPFCGEADTDSIDVISSVGNWPALQCQNCGAQGPCIELSEDKARERWNRRIPTLSALDARKEGMEAAAKVVRDLQSSGENKDKWTVTRDMAFYACEQAILAAAQQEQGGKTGA